MFAFNLPLKQLKCTHIHKITKSITYQNINIEIRSTNPYTHPKSDRITYRTVKMIFKMTDLCYVLVIKCKYILRNEHLNLTNNQIFQIQFKRRNTVHQIQIKHLFYYPICTILYIYFLNAYFVVRCSILHDFPIYLKNILLMDSNEKRIYKSPGINVEWNLVNEFGNILIRKKRIK